MPNPLLESLTHGAACLALGLVVLTVPERTFPQSDSAGATRSSINGYPYVFYSPETRVAFGAILILTFHAVRDSTTQTSSLALNAFASLNSQYDVSLTPEIFFAGNRQWCTATLEFGRFTDRFWGIGQPAADHEAIDFTKQVAHVLLRAQTALFGHARVGIILEADQTSIHDAEESARLQKGGSIAPGGARSAGIGASLTWDSRDNAFYPGTGGLYQFESTLFPEFLGSEFAFTGTTLDLRRYITLGGPQIVAFQLYGSKVSGTPPFFKLSALGGESMMRGYYQGRYRDLIFATVQAEYRLTLSRLLGIVAFAGAGDVGSTPASFSVRTLKASAGLGLRFALNQDERLNVRVDWGFGRGTDGLYFSIREAF
jgi:outer membrane protein assembly factor BamA